jgi:DNA-binding MarR family transcriptional regulator
MDRRLLFVLHRATRAAVGRANARLARAGVSVAQLATLSHLGEHPGCTMTDIASLLDLNKSAASGMLRRLERAGLVRREPSPDDARASLFHVTAEGQEARRRAGPTFRAFMSELTGGLRERELDTVLGFLNNVVERCGSETGDHTS